MWIIWIIGIIWIMFKHTSCMAMIAYTYIAQHSFNVTCHTTLHYQDMMMDILVIFQSIYLLVQINLLYVGCFHQSSSPWLFRSCDGGDLWYCSHAGNSTHCCNDGTWNRQMPCIRFDSFLDMQKMIRTCVSSCLEETVANHCGDISLWFVLHMSDSMWSRMKACLVAWRTHDVCLCGNDALFDFFGGEKFN